MKAKDYAERYNKAEDKEKELVEIAIDFDTETSSLIKSRNIKTDNQFKSVLNEMNLKWEAFAKLTNVNKNSYKIIMSLYLLHLK